MPDAAADRLALQTAAPQAEQEQGLLDPSWQLCRIKVRTTACRGCVRHVLSKQSQRDSKY